MSGVLVLGAQQEADIKAAIAEARKNPVPWSVMKAIADGGPTAELLLGDHKVGVDFVRRRYPSQQVMVGTYRCAVSFEYQPAGLFRHLSISTKKGMLPGLAVMAILIPAFGFSGLPLRRPGRFWKEEFEPGWFAANIIELEPDTPEDHRTFDEIVGEALAEFMGPVK